MTKGVFQKRIYRIAVSSFFFLAGLTFSSWASRIPDIQAKLHLNNAALGAVLLGLPAGLLISLPIAGWLVAKFGSRPIAIGAALLYACTLPMLGFVQNKGQLFGCLFIFGMGGNMLNISMNTQAVSTEVLYGRSIMASYHGLWSLAGFSGAAIGTLMLALGLTPVQHFLIIDAMAFLIIAFASKYLLVEDVNAKAQGPIFARPDRSLINLGLIAFCSMICEGAMFDWSGVYFQKVVQPGKGLVTLGFTAFMCTMATGRFVGDWVVTTIGKKRTLQWSGLLTASGLLIAVIFPYLITAVAGFLLVGAGVSSVVPLIYSSAGKSKVLSPGVAIAAVSTIGYLGFLFGPPFIGFIAQVSGLRTSLGLIAVLGSIIAVIASQNKFE
ncbi:MAG TPA: MFS transporter [Puia sp.]|nr:MFS transporter [Puia sp.]